jgi:hypothetical protein
VCLGTECVEPNRPSHLFIEAVGYKKFMIILDKNIDYLKEIKSGLKFPKLNLGLKYKQCVNSQYFWSKVCQHELGILATRICNSKY